MYLDLERQARPKRRQEIAQERRRYAWQGVWLSAALLTACVLGMVLGFYYTD
jgi:F0F1-type ATP synthase assembly protein I